jgi:RNA polymerase sigma factor (sigma-70 family)
MKSPVVDWTNSQFAVERFCADPTPENRERACAGYQRLVYRIANQYAAHADVDDLIGEGFYGLVRALEKYDIETKLQFSTFAAHYIRGFIQHYLSRRNYPIHVPCWVTDFYTKQSKVITHLIANNLPTEDADIAAGMGITLTRYLHVTKNNPHFHFESVEEITDRCESKTLNEAGYIPESLQTDFRGQAGEESEVTELFQELFNECKGKSALKIAQILKCDTITATEIHELLNKVSN